LLGHDHDTNVRAMDIWPGRVRTAAIGAPVLLFLYGVLRLIDGRRGSWFGWDLGHSLFLVAFLLLGALVVGLRQMVRGPARWARVVADLAMIGGVAGAACFVWGILGDLFPRVHDSAPVPGPLQTVGPLLFQIGVLGLLVMLVATRPRRLPIWTPILVLAGFLLFALNLDLIPVGALVVLIGLSPLARQATRPT
jgi:hypothetical protein